MPTPPLLAGSTSWALPGLGLSGASGLQGQAGAKQHIQALPRLSVPRGLFLASLAFEGEGCIWF